MNKKINRKIDKLFQTLSVQYIFSARNAPHRAIIVSNRSGNYQLHAVDFVNNFSRQITYKRGGALFGSISADGENIFVLSDREGNEYGHFLKIRFIDNKAIDITPQLPSYFSYSISSSNNSETLCFTASIKNKNYVFVTKIKGNSYITKKIYTTKYFLSESICSHDGDLVCVAERNPQTKKSKLMLLYSARTKHILRSRIFEEAVPLAFSYLSKTPKVLALIKKGNWLRPVFWDFEKRQLNEIKHNKFRGDTWVLRWDENRDEMILCDVYQAQQRLYLYNTKIRTLKQIGPQIGSFNLHFNSVARLPDGSLIIKWSNFNTSPRLIYIRSPHYKNWEEIPEWSGNLISRYEIKSAWCRSSDGERVHMWIALPTQKPKERVPFVIDIHGGPHSVVGDEFSPEAQAWLTNGFGYCAVNYRGSIGFGKKFERKIYGNPGHWEVEDIVAARKWLVRYHNADPNNVILYGWSWGGYITLLALGKYPSLWSRGIAGSSIADWIIQYEDEPAYFKAQDREIFKGTPKTAWERYIRSSPINYADHIQVPILLLHGKNDIRCPSRQIKHFINKLKKMNKNISIFWFSSGHIGEFTDVSLRLKLMDKIFRFAAVSK